MHRYTTGKICLASKYIRLALYSIIQLKHDKQAALGETRDSVGPWGIVTGSRDVTSSMMGGRTVQMHQTFW